jgi:Family of unknown function (DUF6112)
MSHLLHIVIETVTPSSPPTLSRPSPAISAPIDPPMDPNAPGGQAFAQIVGAVKLYALLFSLLGVLISGCVFGIGRYIANAYAAVGGRIGFFACLGTAAVVGGGAQLVQWAFSLGNSF